MEPRDAYAAPGLAGAIRDLLRACGQVLFADSALAGACLVFGMALYSARAALLGLVGAALCSLYALLMLPRSERALGQGLHGANGLLLGGFWSWYFQAGPASLACLAGAALATSLLHAALSRLLRPTGLPVLSLPSNLALLAALVVLRRPELATALPPESLFLQAGATMQPLLEFLPGDTGEPARLAREFALPAWAAILAGLAGYSGVLLRAALLGVGLGVGLAWAALGLFPAEPAASAAVFVGFNALPLALALYGFFFPPGWRGLLLACAAAPACAACWLFLSHWLGAFRLPFLTLPFAACLLAVLGAQRLRQALGRRVQAAVDDARPLPRPAASEPRIPAAEPGEEAARLADLLRGARRVSLLCGAGTSTESGIPDIRGRSPFWKDFPAGVFHPALLQADPPTQARFRDMDRRFLALVQTAAPSGAHHAMRRLAELGRLSCVATQNVDGLFQRAGVPEGLVRELHGTVFRLRCLACGQSGPRPADGELPPCPCCGGFQIPDMVLMGEAVDRRLLDEVLFGVCSSDLLLVAGTSLMVDPAASVCTLAAQRGVQVVILNLEPTPQDRLAGLVLRRPAGELLAEAVGLLEVELGGRPLPAQPPRREDAHAP